jgi:adenine deaminase
VTVEEAAEKLARGMFILIREATNARNLDALLPLITPANSRRIGFCTDDRTPPDLLRDGSIDMMVRRAIAAGVEPVTAFRMATLNTAEWFGLRDRGAVAPGRLADLIIFDDLAAPHATEVYVGGRKYDARADTTASIAVPAALTESLRFPPGEDGIGIGWWNFDVPARTNRIRVIDHRPDQLVTDAVVLDANVVRGSVTADLARDLLKIAVIERHRASGRVGLGFIRGFGLKRGAIAGTFAHDHHNLVVIGADDFAMRAAAHHVARMGGGLAVSSEDRIPAELPLPVAGLMSDRPITDVAGAYTKLLAAARSLGCTLHDPFMAMSFMALEVIPSLKLTDQGLVDVDAFRHVDLFV